MFQFVRFRIISRSICFLHPGTFIQVGMVSYQFARKSLRRVEGNLFFNIIKVSNKVETVKIDT